MKIKPKTLLYLLFLIGIWGSSFILMKRGMFTQTGQPIFSATQVASTRILLASLVFTPLLPRLFKQLRAPKDYLYFCVVGLGGNLIPAFLFTYAEQRLDTSLAGIMNSFTPIFTLIVGVLVFGLSIRPLQLVGTLIGFAGISWLLSAGKHLDPSGNLPEALALLVATLLYGFSLNTIKNKLSHYPPELVATGGFSTALIPSVIGFFAFKTPRSIAELPHAQEGLLAIALLGLLGTAFAVFIFNRLIQESNALTASTVTYFIPIVAVIIGTTTNHEQLHSQQYLAMMVIIFGILLTNQPWRNKIQEKA
ncbi:MAG: hypothetical protein RLZZ301_1688 [Bacteroidota bacterium]|jgi:drug/metabolite transporter (DMT)-like permease